MECEEKMCELERRVLALEAALDSFATVASVQADAMVEKYGMFVSKTDAAQILGVARSTVYAMIRDGRIQTACGGSKIDARSIARNMNSRKAVNDK